MAFSMPNRLVVYAARGVTSLYAGAYILHSACVIQRGHQGQHLSSGMPGALVQDKSLQLVVIATGHFSSGVQLQVVVVSHVPRVPAGHPARVTARLGEDL